MSAAPDLLLAFIRFIAYAPFSLMPVLSWSVFTAVALSLYFYYKPMPLDYIFTPIALAYIMYSAYKRDRWGGLAGAALGVVLIYIMNWSGILADASQLFWGVLTYLVAALWQFAMGWSLLVFTAGFFAGIMPFISVVFGVVAGLLTGFAVSGVSAYIAFISSSSRKLIHKATEHLPPGALALTALPAAAFIMAVEVALAIVILMLAAVFTIGFILGSLAGSVMIQVKVAADGISYIAGLLITKFWHNMNSEVFSPVAWAAVVIAYFAGAGTPALVLALATPTLLSSLYGYKAYTWMAVALSVHAFLVSVHAV